MSVCAIASALVLCCQLNSARGATPDKSAPFANEVALLNAINFALTGHDGVTYTFINRRECVVTSARPSAQPDVQAVETIYLNNIDASRIGLRRGQSKSEFETTDYVQVELHGESVIAENGFQPPVTPSLRQNDVTLKLGTDEFDRVARAWRYVYSHGCKSAMSSF